MSRYRSIEVATWEDAWFRSLGEQGQLIWLFLLTGGFTTNIPGVVLANPLMVAQHFGWASVKGFRIAFDKGFTEAWDQLAPKVIVYEGHGTPFMWLPNAVKAGRKSNQPASVKVIKNWSETWKLLPESDAKVEIWRALKAFTKGISKAFEEAFLSACFEPKPFVKALAKPFAQGQGQGQDLFSSTSVSGVGLAPAQEALSLSAPARGDSKRKGRAPRSQKNAPEDAGDPKPRLPFTVAQLIAAFKRGAGDRFAEETWDDGLVKPLTALIRRLAAKNLGLEHAEAAGRVVAGWDLNEPIGVLWLAKTGNLVNAIAKANGKNGAHTGTSPLDALRGAADMPAGCAE